MIHSFFNYIRDSISELRKVTWPSRRELIYYTLLVIGAIVVATIIVAAIDAGLNFLVDQFLIK